MKNSTTRQWVRGIVGGFIGGGASAITGAMAVPMIDADFIHHGGGAWALGELAITLFIANGAVSALLYLKQHPLPEENSDD